MDKEASRDYVLEWIGKSIEAGVERTLRVSNIRSRATIVIGPRRAGKTYYLYQIANKIGKDKVLYLNFEDTRLRNIEPQNIRDLIRIYIEITSRPPTTLLFDEIQNVSGWELIVRELLDAGIYSIYITGSSSRMLSKEIATQLRGRSITYLMLPFSFAEYLKAKGKEDDIKITKDAAAALRNALRDYLEWGGFPESTLNPKSRESILKEYYDLILFRDIIERNSMRNISLARFLLEQLLQNFSKEFSINGIMNKVSGISMSKDATYDYVDKIQDSAALFFLNKFSSSVKAREGWPKKAYVCDTGLTKIVRFSSDIGKLMENCVFLELMRFTNESPLLRLFYWKSKTQEEIDFVLKESDRVSALVQVTYASSRDEIAEREINALVSCSKELNCKRLVIVTWDYESIIKFDKASIECIPLWKWLLTKQQY
jgi:predicted AAA+ superfamily ATPase